jgi:hypothetical protein
MDLEQTGSADVDWIGLVQYRDKSRVVVKEETNVRVPLNACKFLNNCTSGGLSRRF